MKKTAKRSASPYAGKRVLITGGLGFIGSTLAHRLVSLGAKVRVMDSLLPHSGGSLRNVHGIQRQLEILVEDTRERDMVYRAVDGCDIVFHLASPSGPGAASGDWIAELDIACLGTLHVLDAVRVLSPRARLVFASSHHVYGVSRGKTKETAPTNPTTLFGAHKLAGEKYCLVYAGQHDVDAVIARFSSVFGPRQRVRDSVPGTFAHLLDAALHDEALQIGDASGEDLLYVDDAVHALETLGVAQKARGMVVNVGSGRAVPAAHVAAAIVKAVGNGRTPKASGRSKPAPAGVVMDTAALDRLGGAAKRRDLAAAIAQTVEWFKGTTRAV